MLCLHNFTAIKRCGVRRKLLHKWEKRQCCGQQLRQPQFFSILKEFSTVSRNIKDVDGHSNGG